MHFYSNLVPVWVCWVAIVLTLSTLFIAFWLAPWRLLFRVGERQHLFFGTIIMLLLIWTMSISVKATVSFHLLMITSVVLILGMSFGVIVALIALLVRHVLLDAEWMMIGVDAVCTVLIPSLVPLLWTPFIRRISVAPLFVFTLGAGFLGGALTAVAACLAGLMVLGVSQQHELLLLALEQGAVLPLLMFGEGFINGTIVTALAVFQPNWVRTYHEP